MLAGVFVGKLGMSLRHEMDGERRWVRGLRKLGMLVLGWCEGERIAFLLFTCNNRFYPLYSIFLVFFPGI
jgi:hypothetical protein